MFNAVMIGEVFADVCKNGAFGEVHSIFERAMNIQISKEDKLLTLVCGDLDIMAAGCVVNAPHGCWREMASVGDKMLLTPDVVYIENRPYVGGIASAELWQRLSDESISGMDKPAYANLLNICVDIEGRLDKLDKGLALQASSLDELDPIDLIGLGDGLTPAGDDFLAGMLYALHFFELLYGKCHPGLPKIADIISQNLNRTGIISRHFLRYALKGEWGRNTENFLTALVQGVENDLHNAIDVKLGYGASSGADELRGCLFGAKEYLKRVGGLYVHNS